MKNFFTSFFASLTALVVFSFIGGIIFIAFIVAAVVSSANVMSEPAIVKPNTVLELRLQGEIVEHLSEDEELIANFSFSGQEDIINIQSLADIRKALMSAAITPNIKGVYVRADMFTAGYSTLREIRYYLQDFKERSGKFVVAYADNYSQKAYFVASAADKVYLNPQGMLDLRGLSSQTMYVKNTLEKVGVEMTVVKHGKYKSAVEPYLTDKMSDESREQTTELLNSTWKMYCDEVSASRNLSSPDIYKYADEVMGFQDPKLYVKYNLVDSLLYYDEMLAELKNLVGINKGKDLERMLTSKYAKGVQPVEKLANVKDKIAIIYAEGAIDGGARKGINSDKLIKNIRDARSDKNVKAIVLRLNTPGGSAYGSEQVWRELMVARDSITIVASMGDVAASGGYYIASAAHKIVADPHTITGSIGIFATIPNISKLEEKLDLKFDGVQTNKMADFLNPNRPVTEQEKAMLQAYVERGYDTFLQRCADGRGMTKEQIDAVGQGRVWTGEKAKELGLVDELGYTEDAFFEANILSGIEDYIIDVYPKPEPLLESLLKSLNTQTKTLVMKARYGEYYQLYQYAERIKGMQGLQARMPFDLEIY